MSTRLAAEVEALLEAEREKWRKQSERDRVKAENDRSRLVRAKAEVDAALEKANTACDGWRERAEAAEADCAKLLEVGRKMHEVAQNVMRFEVREKLRYELLAVLEAARPGAALLEELRRLQQVAQDATRFRATGFGTDTERADLDHSLTAWEASHG